MTHHPMSSNSHPSGRTANKATYLQKKKRGRVTQIKRGHHRIRGSINLRVAMHDFGLKVICNGKKYFLNLILYGMSIETDYIYIYSNVKIYLFT